jgi:hypothetical protein
VGRSVREIERKYAVDVLVVPDLDGVPGVATVDGPGLRAAGRHVRRHRPT